VSRRTSRARVVLPALVLGSVLAVSACGGGSKKVAAPTTVAPTTVAPTTVAPTTTTSTTVAPEPMAPLTGLPASSPAVLTRPAVVVKIDNVDQARPQTGINQADVIYEEMVEGGLTRLAAVFQSQLPDPVGPIRSGRTTDLGIIGDLDHPVLVYSGANSGFLEALGEAPATNVNADNHPTLFFRGGTHPAPHNYFADATDLVAQAPAGSPPPPALFTYGPAGHAAAAGATPMATATVTFPAARAVWTWNAGTGVFSRAQNGTPDVDITGVPVGATNVVIQTIPYSTALVEAGGTIIPEGNLVGSGKAWVLTGGDEVPATWTRTSLTAVTTYTDSAGNPIVMNPGQTWVELLPTTSAAPAFTP
jgi:hypothetical protein